MNIEIFKQKVELVKDQIPRELYLSLLAKDDLNACTEELNRYVHINRTLNPQIDWLYAFVHERTHFYQSRLNESDKRQIQFHKGNRHTIS